MFWWLVSFILARVICYDCQKLWIGVFFFRSLVYYISTGIGWKDRNLIYFLLCVITAWGRVSFRKGNNFRADWAVRSSRDYWSCTKQGQWSAASDPGTRRWASSIIWVTRLIKYWPQNYSDPWKRTKTGLYLTVLKEKGVCRPRGQMCALNLLYFQAACFGPNISSSGPITYNYFCSSLFITVTFCLVAVTDDRVIFGTWVYVNVPTHYIWHIDGRSVVTNMVTMWGFSDWHLMYIKSLYT